MSKKTQVGRLGFRQEGDFWCAYFINPSDMKDALLLGSIRLSAVKRNEQLRVDFMETMQLVVADAIQSKFGVSPSWSEPTDAPEHERSGNA